MIIKINGKETPINTSGVQRVTDLIELIKSMIDPTHMITAILINGRELDEQEWTGTISQFEAAVLEIETGEPETYVYRRLATAPEIIGQCFMSFREARKNFQNGNMQVANRKLLAAVNTLREFFSWYATLLELLSEDKRKKFDITALVTKISETCKTLCQQQLYQSWWAIGETLRQELEPELDQLEDFCIKSTKDLPITGVN